ncbi:oxidoreductase [Purpureocillium lavendulum]|uniref:Oxidoreductase n=1 Tax=Purpureocillium lavendulum TaxID=1247861 RepID=A0AB34G766_9HYPO|nr:oxidoreductase [Purpureocillium lavendulum]
MEETEILVRVRCVALNPTDFKHVDILSPRGAVIGCDYSGTVAKVGGKAPGNWKIGDRVAGWVHGGLYPDRGSFAEYLRIPGDLAWKIPSSVSDEEATTFGVSAVTAMLALNTRLNVPWIDNGPATGRSDTPILIYSGSTSAGLYAIQLAKLAGLKVVTTASTRSHNLVKEYGADEVFDYRSPTAVADILRVYPNIDRALDCYSEGGSTRFCAEVVSKNRGRVVTLLDSGKTTMDGVEIDFLLAYSVFNEEFQWLPPFGPKFARRPSDNAALRRFYSTLPEVSKRLRPPPLKKIDGGLDQLRCPDIDVLDNSTHLPAELRSSLINTAQAVNDYGNDNNNNIEREPSKEVSKSNLAKHKKSQACRLTHGTNSPDNNDVPMAVSSTTLPGVGHMQSKARMKRRRRENTDDDDDDDDDDDGATHQELKRLRQDLSEERRRHAETMEEVQKLKRALQEANDNSKEEKRQLGVLLETVRNLSGIVLRMGGSNSGVVGQHEGTF